MRPVADRPIATVPGQQISAFDSIDLSVVGATVCGMGPGEAITLMVDVGRGEEAEVGFVLARKIRRVYMMVGLVRADIASLHADVRC